MDVNEEADVFVVRLRYMQCNCVLQVEKNRDPQQKKNEISVVDLCRSRFFLLSTHGEHRKKCNRRHSTCEQVV